MRTRWYHSRRNVAVIGVAAILSIALAVVLLQHVGGSPTCKVPLGCASGQTTEQVTATSGTDTVAQASPTTPPSSSPSPTVSQVSPTTSAWLFGTNMGLFTASDQIATRTSTQQYLRSQRMRIMRIPFRTSLSDAAELQGLQAIKAIGATPLATLHGAVDSNVLTDDKHLLQLVQSVFGASTVYVEYGNEEDLAGVNVSRYTQSWNAVVPTLKAMAPTYKFVGPVNFQYDPSYVATFDQTANPRPDLNSWHEYVCNTSESDSYCLQHIGRWTAHLQLTNTAVQAAIGRTLPVMITEWNLDPQQDPRYTNAGFMQQWTTSALQTLAANQANGLLAAMQYCATNNQGFDLLDGNNNPTPEGQVFFTLRQRVSG